MLFTLLFGGWIQLHQSYHSGLWAGAPMLIEVVLEGGVGGLLAICGIAFGVERGLRRFGSPPQTAEAEGPASDEEA